MANPLPSALALSTINDGDQAIAAPLRNNFSFIQSAVNLLRTCLAGGTAGQFLQAADGSDVQWATTPGAELAYAEITTNATTTQTTEASATTIISLPATSFDGSAVMVEFFSPLVLNSSTSATTIISLWEGSTEICRLGSTLPGAANAGGSELLKRKFTPAAGSHTYLIKAHVSGASTGTITAGGSGTATYNSAYARITKA